MTRPTLNSTLHYSRGRLRARWKGRVVSGRERFRRYLREVAGARLEDRASSFEWDLRGLASTGMVAVVLMETGKE